MKVYLAQKFRALRLLTNRQHTFAGHSLSISDGDAILMAQKLAANLRLAVGVSSGCNFLFRALATAPIIHRRDQPLLATKSADLAWEQIRAPRTRCNLSPRSLSLPHPTGLPACCPAHVSPALRPYGSAPATGCFFGSCESNRLP